MMHLERPGGLFKSWNQPPSLLHPPPRQTPHTHIQYAHTQQHPHWKLGSLNLDKNTQNKSFWKLYLVIYFFEIQDHVSVWQTHNLDFSPPCNEAIMFVTPTMQNEYHFWVCTNNEWVSSPISAVLATLFTIVCWLLFYWCNHRKQ